MRVFPERTWWLWLATQLGFGPRKPQRRRYGRRITDIPLGMRRYEERRLLTASFALVDPVVTEGQNAVFAVTYLGGSIGMVAVNYHTQAGSAGSPGDYTAASGTLYFPSPGMTQNISVATLMDNLPEGTESFQLVLTDYNSGATLATGTCTLNDPAAPHIGLRDSGGNTIANGTGSVDYGTVAAGQSLSKSFTIINTGNASLSVNSVSVTGGGIFTTSGFTPGNVAPGGSKAFNIVFSPTTGTPFNGTVTVNSNDMQTFNYTFGVHGVGNGAPTANNDGTYTVLHDHALTVAGLPAGGLLYNDADPENSPLAAALVAGPAHGTLNLIWDGGFTYTPTAHYTGPDSFTYRAYDGTSYSQPATVQLMVMDSPPTAIDHGYSTLHDRPLDVTAAAGVLQGASDSDNDPLTAVLVTGPAHSTEFTLNADGSFHY